MKRMIKPVVAVALILLISLAMFTSCDPEVKLDKEALDFFWLEFKGAAINKVVRPGIAAVDMKENGNITVVFPANVEPSDVQEAAEELFTALKDIVDDGEGTLTLYAPEKKTFTLSDANVVEEVARHLLDNLDEASVDNFLTSGNVSSKYLAEFKYYGRELKLEGTLKFDVTDPK